MKNTKKKKNFTEYKQQKGSLVCVRFTLLFHNCVSFKHYVAVKVTKCLTLSILLLAGDLLLTDVYTNI